MALSALDILRAKARAERAARAPEPPAWNEAVALAYLRKAADHLAALYPEGAFPWAERDRPDLLEALHAAETVVDETFRAQDRAAFIRAADAHEATVRALFDAFRARYDRPPAPEAETVEPPEPVQLGLLAHGEARGRARAVG